MSQHKIQPWSKSKWVCILTIEIVLIATIVLAIMYANSIHNQFSINDEDYIAKFNQKNLTYQIGAVSLFNKYTLKNAAKILNNILTNQTQKRYCTSTAQLNVKQLPKSYNFRQQKAFCQQTIYTQGRCSSSYSIATVSAINDRVCLNAKEKIFSVFSPIFCDSTNNNCNGGSAERTLQFLLKFGLVEQNCYQYLQNIRDEAVQCKIKTSKCQKHRIYNYCYLEQSSIKHDIWQNGPVVASLKVTRNFFIYKSGVYTKNDDNQQFRGNQIVKIIGWNFTNGVDYWIIENTWGEDWGKKGIGAVQISYANINLAISIQIDAEYASNVVLKPTLKQFIKIDQSEQL